MNKELLHGTTTYRIPEFLNGIEDLYGVRYLNNPPMSAVLTDALYYANNCAVGAFFIDQEGYPVILHFTIPTVHLVYEGHIGGNKTIMGYSTTFLVEQPQTLPPRFLRNLGITVEIAIQKFAVREVEFYRVPRQFYTRLDSIDLGSG